MDEIENILLKQVQGNCTPSVQYIVFNKDSILKRYEAGFADIKKEIEANPQTTYNAFSVTKTFTALAIMQLAEQNKLWIDKTVKNYLPEFPYSSEITIQHLLTHHAGIPNPIPLNWIHLATEQKSFNRNDFFNSIYIKHPKTAFKPNEKFAYSNLGYVLLGRLIEKVSGMRYEEYIEKNVINKLDVDRSDLSFEIHDQARHAKGYHKNFNFLN